MLPARAKTRQHCCAPRGHDKCFWIFSETFCARGKTSQHLGNMITSAMLLPGSNAQWIEWTLHRACFFQWQPLALHRRDFDWEWSSSGSSILDNETLQRKRAEGPKSNAGKLSWNLDLKPINQYYYRCWIYRFRLLVYRANQMTLITPTIIPSPAHTRAPLLPPRLHDPRAREGSSGRQRAMSTWVLRNPNFPYRA